MLMIMSDLGISRVRNERELNRSAINGDEANIRTGHYSTIPSNLKQKDTEKISDS